MWRADGFQTSSGIPLKPVYLPDDVRDMELGVPGQAPFTRGAYAEMYRRQPWRIFQLSGFGNPEDEGERIRFLLEHGETGFIMEHDRNIADHLYNVDHPEVSSRREDVGRFGAVILGVRDYETVLNGIDMEHVYAHPGGGVVQHGPFALACYWTIAQRRGIPLERLYGTGQSDFFLTYVGCFAKEQVPPAVGLRFNCDLIEFCNTHLPHWVPVSIAGYNGAETGLNGYQEVGAVLANALQYVDGVLARGRLKADEIVRQVGGVNFRTSMDIFEDAAKFRAARRLWCDLLTDRYGIHDDRLRQLRIHALTAGSAMTYQQPLNNIARGTLMGLAGVLGGAQSMGISGYDEALSVPSEHAHQMSVRIQQILQNECGLAGVADPLGGSYYVERLTEEIYERGREFVGKIEDHGGFVAALDDGWLHSFAIENQVSEMSAIDSGERTVVGVNSHRDDVTPWQIGGFEGVEDAYEKGLDRLRGLRRARDDSQVSQALQDLEGACRSDSNIMPFMLAAVSADVTVGEIGDVFREVFGNWDVPVQF